MIRLTAEQFSLSTAEEERNLFTGQPVAPLKTDEDAVMPAGTYRVLEGRLYRVVDEVAPLARIPGVPAKR